MTSSIKIYPLKENDMVDSIPLNSKGQLVLEMSESCPETKTYDDAITKLIYIICLQDGNCSKKLEKVIREYTDAKKVIVNNYFNSMWQYVKKDMSRDKLLTEEGFRDFVFNPRSLLIIKK